MKTTTNLVLNVKVSNAKVLVSSDKLIEPGAPIARLDVDIAVENPTNEIFGLSENAIDLHLFDATGEEVFLLTDNRDRELLDARPLGPNETAHIRIEASLSATYPELGKDYSLRASIGEILDEVHFTFDDPTQAKPR